MKFLLSCCGATLSATRRDDPTTSEQVRSAEEMSSLVSPSRQRRRRKRGSPGASGSSSPTSTEWRPSLISISEDTVLMASRKEHRTAGDERERALKRKSGPERARVRVRSHSDDYGRSSLPAIPAFSPTPFMF